MLSGLSPATRREISTALAHREQHGQDMSPSAMIRLAHGEGVRASAALITVLGLGISPDGWPVKLSDRCADIVVPDIDTRHALINYGRRRVRAHIVQGPYIPW